MNLLNPICRAGRQVTQGIGLFVRDVGNGMLEVFHNSLAMLGLAVVASLVFVGTQPELRQRGESLAFGWLHERHLARAEASGDVLVAVSEPEGVGRATAADPAELNRQQGLVTRWLAKRYRVAPEPVARLVQEAWHMGGRAGLEPTLILAIMAIESSFNPFAQSPVGAQGLMQVMTRMHDDKYSAFGGSHAAFDPVSNLRVGVQVLRDCIARFGGVEAGLKAYVGAANLPEDGGYAHKVLAEQGFLRRVAAGGQVSVTVIAPALPAPGRDALAPLPRSEPEATEKEQVAQLGSRLTTQR